MKTIKETHEKLVDFVKSQPLEDLPGLMLSCVGAFILSAKAAGKTQEECLCVIKSLIPTFYDNDNEIELMH